MKTLKQLSLIVAMIVSAAMASARSLTLPDTVLGNWLWVEADANNNQVYTRSGKKCTTTPPEEGHCLDDLKSIYVDKAGYYGDGFGCEFVRIGQGSHPQSFVILASCHSVRQPYDEEAVLEIRNEQLLLTERNLSNLWNKAKELNWRVKLFSPGLDGRRSHRPQ